MKDVGKLSMDEEVYGTTHAKSNELTEEKGSAVKAIFIASSVDIIATLFIGMVISMVYGVLLASNGDSLEVITSKLSNVEFTSIVSIISLITASVITVYTGYLCAKLVNHSEYMVAAIFALIVIIFEFAMGLSNYSMWENLLLSLLTLCCVYIGTWLYVSKKNRRLKS
jgi:heme A synthase